MGAIRKFVLFVLLIVFVEGVSQAKLRYQILYNIINQSGNGGKQVYDGSGDQELTVYQPTLFMDYEIDSNTNVSGNFLLDTFSGASDAIFDANTGASSGVNTLTGASTGSGTGTGTTTGTDTNTGASSGGVSSSTGTARGSGSGTDDAKAKKAAAGNAKPAPRHWEQRKAFDLSLAHKSGTWVIAPSLGYSNEVDYRSLHGGFNVQKSFAEDNFTLSAGIFHYDDWVQVFNLSLGSFNGWTPKVTDSYILSASQILSSDTIMLVGASFTRQEGFLASNRNTVDLAGTRVSEALPDQRNKITSTVRFIQAINRFLALHFDYRYYTDDWKLTAHTYAPSLAIGFGDFDAGLVQLFYRFYTQNGTKYYGDRFNTRAEFMTSDSDLAPFDSREMGLSGSYRIDLNGFFKSLELGAGFFYYERTNDLKATIYQINIGGSF